MERNDRSFKRYHPALFSFQSLPESGFAEIRDQASSVS